jgi:uncharacterized protein (TIGR02271 family)
MAGRPLPPVGERTPKALFEGGQEARIPIVEEEVRVGKRDVETGRVRVHTVVDEEKLNLTELLERDVVEIERVTINREVAQAPLPFEEGDVLVIPVIEERLVVEKRLVVVEEVRIRRRKENAPADIPVTRRVMHAEIERTAPSPNPPGPPPQGVDPRLWPEGPARAASLHPFPAGSRIGVPHQDGDGDRARPGQSRTPAQGHAAARPAAGGTNWAMVALVAAAVLLLLLVLASRS